MAVSPSANKSLCSAAECLKLKQIVEDGGIVTARVVELLHNDIEQLGVINNVRVLFNVLDSKQIKHDDVCILLE